MAAAKPAASGLRTVIQKLPAVIVVPLLVHKMSGTTRRAMTDENAVATPVGPNFIPTTAPNITQGAMRNAMFKLRRMRPDDIRNQAKGLIRENTSITGVR